MWTEKIYIIDGCVNFMVTCPKEIESEIIRLHREWVCKSIRILLSTGQTIESDSSNPHIVQ